MSSSARLLTSLACTVAFASLTGCAATELSAASPPTSAGPASAAPVAGQQMPFPARVAPRLSVKDQPLVRAAIAGRATPAQASTQPSAPPADGSPRVLSTSPLWIERVVGETTLLQRISEDDLSVVSELSLPGVGESIVEGRRLVHVAKDGTGQRVRAVSLLLGYVVGDWELGSEPAALVGAELATGQIRVRRGEDDLVFTAGEQTPSSTVRLTRR